MSKHKTIKVSDLKILKVTDIDLSNFEEHKSSMDFSNAQKVREILMEHFMAGEHDTFLEILALYLDHVGKAKVALETKIPQRTIYNFIKGDHKTSSENVFKVMKFVSEEARRFSA
jgi:hypothetical protein